MQASRLNETLQIMDTLRPGILSFVVRLSSSQRYRSSFAETLSFSQRFTGTRAIGVYVAGGHVPPSLFWPRGPGVMEGGGGGGGGGGGTTDLNIMVQFMKVWSGQKVGGKIFKCPFTHNSTVLQS